MPFSRVMGKGGKGKGGRVTKVRRETVGNCTLNAAAVCMWECVCIYIYVII